MLFSARELEDGLRRTDSNGKLEERERGRTEDEVRRIQEERIQVHQRLTELVAEIREHDRDFPPHAKPLNSEDIFTLSQDADATLVLFRVTGAGTFVFLVFPDRTFEVVEVRDFTLDALNNLLLRLRTMWLKAAGLGITMPVSTGRRCWMRRWERCTSIC